MRGSADELAQVVTRTCNVDHAALETVGETARQWMEIAQCFAGGPEPPLAMGCGAGVGGMMGEGSQLSCGWENKSSW